MHFITTLLAAFFVAAAANPIADVTARDPAADIEARKCQIFGIVCTGGVDTEFCEGLGFQCQGMGLPPIISDPTCAANCICPC
ncbi:hypothetical protein C8R43DRAFT_1039378 [Mycena crocata]|nr:hypothetical protein C8R43DRAFT_1039378 [Mycena crocata]